MSYYQWNYMVRSISVGFLYCKVTIFHFVLVSITEAAPWVYANPFSKSFHHLIQEPSDDLFTPERKESIQKTYKEYIEQKNSSRQTLTVNSDTNGGNRGIKNFDVLFDCYSIGDKYHEFTNNIYFREKVSNDNNYKRILDLQRQQELKCEYDEVIIIIIAFLKLLRR